MNAETLMKMAERLAELKQTRDRLTAQRGGDPDKNRFTVRDCGTYIAIRRGGRDRSLTIVGKLTPDVFTFFGQTPERMGTIRQEIRKWEKLVAEARAAGGVEWTERQRLNALARQHVQEVCLRPDYALLVFCKRYGHPVRWIKATTADAKKEQRELKQRLNQIG